MMIKICGITRREDALEAVESGASAIGFIFYPKSPRYISPERARELGDGIAALKVGVFVDETSASIEAVMRSASLDVAQVYGGIAPANARVWKAQRIRSEAPVIDSDDCEAVLLDGQSNGATFDWRIARGAAGRVVIAGGLDSTNVGEAIRIAKPWGVDASSRLESSPGIKDHNKIREFIRAAQAAVTGDT